MASEPWHLDRKVPIAFIVAIVVQTGAAFWYFGSLNGQVQQAVLDNQRQDLKIATIETATNQQAVSAATLSEQISGMRTSLSEVKDAQRETNTLLRQLTQGATR